MIPVHTAFLHLPLFISYGILVGGVFFPKHVDRFPLIIVVIGMLLSSLAIVLSICTDFSFTIRILLLFILFMCTWLQIVRLYGEVSVHWPFPSREITSVEGVARFDSSVSEKGNLVVELLISSVGNRYGDHANAHGILRAVVDSDEFILYGEKVNATGSLKDVDGGILFLADFMEIEEETNWIRETYHELRRTILGWVMARLAILPTKPASLSHTLLIGRDGPESVLRESTTLSGCAHVVALSGMHLHAIIALLAFLWGPLIGTRRVVYITVPAAIAYVAIVGNKPSLVRALLMTILDPVLTRIPLRHGMAYVMLIHAWFFGHTLVSTGSILSYMALSGIFFLAPTIAAHFSLIMPKSLAMVCAVSLGASLTTAPFTFATFGSWYPIGMILGPVLAPIALAILLCALAWIIHPMAPLTAALKICVEWFDHLVGWGSAWTLSHPKANTVAAFMSVVAMLLTVLGILKYAGRIERRRSFRRHDMGFSLRFGQCDHHIARKTRLRDVEEVRTELPPCRTDPTQDCR